MDKYTLLGGLAEVGAHLSLSHVLKYTVGGNPVFQIRDAQGIYVWGVGGDNIINASIGAGLYLVGRKTGRDKLLRMGEGWLFALGITKLSELWLYLTAIDPIPEIQMARLKAPLPTSTPNASKISFPSARFAIAPAKKGAYR